MTRYQVAGRRRFLQAGAALSAFGMLAPSLNASAHTKRGDGRDLPRSVQSVKQPRFAYVSTAGDTSKGRDDGNKAAGHPPCGLHVFAVVGDGWRQVQVMRSDRPIFLVLHPGNRFLYAVNQIDVYQGLATGSVEAYSIDPRDGRLSLLNRQPLSLSGTRPSHAAISPNGRMLVVALSGGGAYDVMPIGPDGRLANVSSILKETGCGPDKTRQRTAQPQMVLFDPSGERILSADLGCDRLSVLTLAGSRLSAWDRIATAPGNGPRELALHPDGRWLYVLNELSATVEWYGYNAGRGLIGPRRGAMSVAPSSVGETGASSATAVALHPSGRFLYAAYSGVASANLSADGIAVFHVDAMSGRLVELQWWHEGLNRPRALALAPDGASLYALNLQGGDILRLNIDAENGTLDQPKRMTGIPAPTCLALTA
ncbi:lactonase family protein [Paraburkholderia fungorum]|uniref:lactonase family protein n=1 Tax=Paraburkholderia fungorum TaxID=134537 RepID=UPI0038BAE422